MGACLDHSQPFLVTEYCPRGSLQVFLAKTGAQEVTLCVIFVNSFILRLYYFLSILITFSEHSEHPYIVFLE